MALDTPIAAILVEILELRAAGNPRAARSRLREAEAAAREGSTDPLVRANILLVQGLLAADTGQTEQALRLLTASARGAGALRGEQPARLRIGALTAVGTVLRDSGDYLGAYLRLRAALRRAVRLFGPDSEAVARVCNELGMTLRYTGRYPRAADCYRRSLRIATATATETADQGRQLEIATIHHNLGGLAHAAGDLAGAEHHARIAVEMREATLGPDHIATAADRGALAAVLLDAGRLAEATELLESARRVFAQAYGPEHYEVAVVLHNLGTAAFLAGEPARAADHLRHSLRLKARALGPDHPDLAATLCNLAHIERSRGALPAASQAYARAAELLRASVEPDHPTLLLCRQALAELRAGSTAEHPPPATGTPDAPRPRAEAPEPGRRPT